MATQLASMTRLWLVERSYDDRNLVSFVYATPDGDKQLRKELSVTLLRQRGEPMTAAVDVDSTELGDVDPADRERYATEATKMQSTHAPDDPI